MYIVRKNKTLILNLNTVNSIYVGECGKIRYISNDGKSYCLDSYSTSECAELAMQILSQKMASSSATAIIEMPSDEEVEVKSRYNEQRNKSANGKKTVRRGGS